jgi:hypothetical protein
MLILSAAGLRVVTCTLLSAALLSACGGGGGSAPAQPSQPSQPLQPGATELTLSASGSTVVAGGAALTLNASLNGAGSVSWALAAGSPGTLSATSGTSVSYTPPASFTGVTTVTISATSGSLSKNIVLQLAPNGPGVTLLAGTVTPGNAIIDGRGAAARFYAINALATDSGGNVYIADKKYNALIRKVSADGTVSSLSADWSALTLDTITAITAMADGSLYFSSAQMDAVGHLTSWTHNTFRKLGADGKLTILGTVADSTPARLWQLTGAPDGTLYVHDGNAIYILGTDGSRQLLAGDSNDFTPADVDGVGAAARFDSILQLRTAADGSLYVLDRHGLRQVSRAGLVTTSLPQNNDDTGAFDLSLDQQGNPLLFYAIKTGATYEVRKFSGGKLSTLSTLTIAPGPVNPHLLGMADGAIVTSDGVSLSRTGTDGKTAVLAGVRNDRNDSSADGQGAQARLTNVRALAADHDGNIYALENDLSGTPPAIRKITPSGAVSTLAGSGLLGNITGMAVTPANVLVVSIRAPVDLTHFGGGVYQLGLDGSFTLIAGSGIYTGQPQQKDGQGNAAVFGAPTLAGVDQDGNLYISDQSQAASDAHTYRKVTPQGAVTTVASLPAALGAAADGNVYQVNNVVATYPSGATIVRVAPDGTRTVVAGVANGDNATNLPGPLPALLYDARSVVSLGGKLFAVAAGNGIYTLVLP